MSINASLIGQMITFLIFVWFCMKFVWPPLMKAIRDRQKLIADGLSAADRSQRELEAAQLKIVEMLDEARLDAAKIVNQAKQHAHNVIEEAAGKARAESERILAQAQEQIVQDTYAARQTLYTEVAQLAILGTEKLLAKNIDAQDATRLLSNLTREVS